MERKLNTGNWYNYHLTANTISIITVIIITITIGQELSGMTSLNETKRQLLLERANYERLMMQMLSLTTVS